MQKTLIYFKYKYLFHFLMAAFLCSSCKLSSDGTEKSSKISVTDVTTAVSSVASKSPSDILQELFPKLTAAEVSSLVAELSLVSIESLKADLEEARSAAAEFSDELATLAASDYEKRKKNLAEVNMGYPTSTQPVASFATYNNSSGKGYVSLMGLLKNKAGQKVAGANFNLSILGTSVSSQATCLNQSGSLDIVILLDITGSMSNVIAAVKDSIQSLVDAIVSSGLKGTISVVTYQDSVGVNIDFMHPTPSSKVERSPFFKPVSLQDSAKIAELKHFIELLEANRGSDAPENLTGAIDFARNNVIGLSSDGSANVVGDGIEDPPNTSAFSALTSDYQTFIAFTDISFHADSRTSSNSSLIREFQPRPIAQVLSSLLKTKTVVNVSDPSWVDKSTSPSGASDEKELDSDFWAISTGGIGYDWINGYSLFDLEVVIAAETKGLLEISLDQVLASTCLMEFTYPNLPSGAAVDLSINLNDTNGTNSGTYTQQITPLRY